MELDTIFYRFNPWWEENYSFECIPRENYLQLLLKEIDNKEITFVTGLRRVGKTTLLKQIIARLLEKGIDKHHIFFISLDHSAFSPMNLLDIVEKYREIKNISVKEKIYLFFDEIQYHPHFERDLKILHDHEQVKIIVSGSNSLMLNDTKAFLTGRNRVITINPLSFKEYLLFTKKEVFRADTPRLKQHFLEYLENGGMPEYVLSHNPERITALVSDIIYKDIVGKHNLKNGKKLEELFLLLCERVGKRVTYNKLANILGIDIETVSSYISYFEETYLVYQLNRYAKSQNEIIRSPKKIYIADNGIRSVFVGFKDKGALFENVVFLKLKNKKISYFYENEKEIDFIIEMQKRKIALEVKYKEVIDTEELMFLEKSNFEEKRVISTVEDFEQLEKLL